MTTFSSGDWKGEEEKSGGFIADRKISVSSSALRGILHFGVISVQWQKKRPAIFLNSSVCRRYLYKTAGNCRSG
jgi:hypothetical protein